MPATAYTITLWELLANSYSGSLTGPGPPGGYIWVVRDVVMTASGAQQFPSAINQAVLSIGQLPIAATPAWATRTNTTYRFAELRQTVGAAELLAFASSSPLWNVRVTGYQLTA